jgi:hypothetical protein
MTPDAQPAVTKRPREVPGASARRGRRRRVMPCGRKRHPVPRTVPGDVPDLELVRRQVRHRVPHGRQRRHAWHSPSPHLTRQLNLDAPDYPP